MSENSKAQIPTTGLVTLTGGLIATGSLGWALFRMFKTQRIDYKEMLIYLVSFTGGMYILKSANVSDSQKSSGTLGKSITSEKEALNMNVPVCEAAALAALLDKVSEWDQIFAREAGASNVLDRKISKNNKQDVISKYEELTKKLKNLNMQGQRNELLNPPADPQMKICFNNEGIASSKAKFKEDIISLINELKGYVQGTINPLPLAKNIKFQPTDISDEKRREIVIIVKEYVNSMQLKLEKTIDEFIYSVCTAGCVLNEKEYEVKNAPETLGIPKKDFSTSIKKENNENCNALEKTTKNNSQIHSCQNGPSFRNVSGTCTRLIQSSSSHNLQEIKWTKTAEPQSPMTPKLETSCGSIPCKLRGINKPSHLAVEKFKSSHLKPPSKMALNQQQMQFLNILKSELEDPMVL